MSPLTLLVAGNPAERALSLLERLPAETRIAVSETPAAFGEIGRRSRRDPGRLERAGVLEAVFDCARACAGSIR